MLFLSKSDLNFYQIMVCDLNQTHYDKVDSYILTQMNFLIEVL